MLHNNTEVKLTKLSNTKKTELLIKTKLVGGEIADCPSYLIHYLVLVAILRISVQQLDSLPHVFE